MSAELNPSDQEAIEKYGLHGFMYETKADLVLCEQTGFPASMGGLSDPAHDPDPVPYEDPVPDWRQQLKDWFDKQYP